MSGIVECDGVACDIVVCGTFESVDVITGDVVSDANSVSYLSVEVVVSADVFGGAVVRSAVVCSNTDCVVYRSVEVVVSAGLVEPAVSSTA